MINRGVKFLHLANWIVAAFLAFVVTLQWDEGSPLQANASLTVTAWDATTPLQELRSEVTTFADEREITFAQEVVDFEQRHAVRHLYLVDGDPAVPGKDWLAGGYRDFTRSTTTSMHEFTELGSRTFIGRYDVFGDTAKASELSLFLAAHGVSSQVDELGTWRSIPAPVLLALAMMIFFCVAVSGAGVIAETKAYGICRLQGLSYGDLLLADLRATVVAWAISGAAVTAAAVAVLWVYNGFAAFGAFVIHVLLLNLLLTATAFVANALALTLIMQVGIEPAIKGELPGRSASAMAYALRFCAVILTVGTLATALKVGLDVAERDRSYATYERLGTTSALSLGNAYTLEDQERLTEVVGAWLREQDRDHQVLLAGRTLLSSEDPLLNGLTVLFVNDAFLKDQPVLLPGGKYAVGESLDVLIPADLWDRGEEIAAALELNVALRKDTEGIGYRSVQTVNGQEFFTYSVPTAAEAAVGAWVSTQAYATDPVIVVLPSSQGLLSDDSYTAFASAAGLLLPTPTTIKDAVAGDEDLQRYVRAVVPVAEQAALEAQTQAREFRLALLTAGIGILVLLITGVGVVLIYGRRNSQLIFARHVSGWRFLAAHRSLIWLEAAVLIILIGLLPYQVWSQSRELQTLKQMGAPVMTESITMSAAQWLTITFVAMVTVGSVLLILARAHRRIVRRGAGEV